MQQDIIEFRKIIEHRLDENWKSFKLLFSMNHYGNCISIMCQELDQMISLLFLLNRSEVERKHLINLSANNHKWYFLDYDVKKKYINEKDIILFADTLEGWDKSIYEFGLSFNKLSINFNYLMKDPIKGMSDSEKNQIYTFIKDYHDNEFPKQFDQKELVPLLEEVFTIITKKIGAYLDKL
jgi:hypothetical protein